MTNSQDTDASLARRHILFGWWTLLLFVILGIVLEYLLAYKQLSYVSDDYETRRLLWRLAHAHGTLTSVLHIAFALTVLMFPSAQQKARRTASACLIATTILLPGGFFAGGIFFFVNDPGYGIFLVPLGAFTLLLAVLLTALSVREQLDDQSDGKDST